jgi:hypothetical protein
MPSQEPQADQERVATANSKPAAWVGYYILEGVRWLIGCTGFLLGLSSGTSTPELLHVFAPFLLLAVAGVSGVEDLLLGRSAAMLSGRGPSVRQRLSGFNNLALAATGLISFVQNWGPAADVALVTVLLISTMLSAADHLWRALLDGRIGVRSFVRAAGIVALLLVVVPILTTVVRGLG